MSTEAQPTTAPAVADETKNVEDPRKVFAGNLAFSTTEAEVKELFSVAGTVIDVTLIHRGTRSLGYGFVTFSTEEEAKKASETLNKKEVGGREINVEGARPQGSVPGANGFKKKSFPKKNSAGPRRPRNEQGEEGGETAGESAAEGAAASGETTKPAKRRPKKKTPAAKKEVVQGEIPAENGEETTTTSGVPKPKRAPYKRTPRPAKTGPPSKTTLFISNLSFKIDDERLASIFSQYQLKTATVIRARSGNKRSKGFGFLEFENEEEQQKALNNENGKSHDDREIHLKVALETDRKNAETAPAEETAANPAVETPLAA